MTESRPCFSKRISMHSDTKTVVPVHLGKTRPTRWLVLSGASLLGLAGGCLLVTCIGLVFVYGEVVNSSASPTPSDLASGIHWTMIPAVISAPMVVLGCVLVLLRVIRHRR